MYVLSLESQDVRMFGVLRDLCSCNLSFGCRHFIIEESGRMLSDLFALRQSHYAVQADLNLPNPSILSRSSLVSSWDLRCDYCA